MMIGVLLPKADPASDDAADALANAVCHAHHRQSAVLRRAAPLMRLTCPGKARVSAVAVAAGFG